ncbi:MAG: hypothetical protein HND47_07375 [Chloroflexi bacterium]|nr:hypothetical protein [Chloroflexota bacterium]
MNRRDFLKLSGLMSTILFLPLGKAANLSIEAQAGGSHYRGTLDGRVYVSPDAGRTWQLHTDFGSMFPVLDMAADGHENVHARLGFSGYTFRLTLSPNSKAWRTV